MAWVTRLKFDDDYENDYQNVLSVEWDGTITTITFAVIEGQQTPVPIEYASRVKIHLPPPPPPPIP